MQNLQKCFTQNTFSSSYLVELVFLEHTLRNTVLLTLLISFYHPFLKFVHVLDSPHPNPSTLLLLHTSIERKHCPNLLEQEPLLSRTNLSCSEAPYHSPGIQSWSIQRLLLTLLLVYEYVKSHSEMIFKASIPFCCEPCVAKTKNVFVF